MPGVSLSGGGFKIRAHPRESRAPQATSSRKSAEDSPFTSSGAQMWRCGWGGGQRIALALGVPPFSYWSGGYIYAGGIRAIARLYVNSLTGKKKKKKTQKKKPKRKAGQDGQGKRKWNAVKRTCREGTQEE